MGLVTIWLTQAVSERMDAANACMLGASLAACPLLPSGRQQAPPSGGAPAAPTPHLESSAAGSRGRESPQRGASRLKAIESGASPAYQLAGPRPPRILNNAGCACLLCYASPHRNRSIAPMGSVRARVTWPCYVIANGSKSSHYPSRPNCLAWAPLSGRNPSR